MSLRRGLTLLPLAFLEAAHTLSLYAGTAAQKLRLYGTKTGAGSEWLEIEANYGGNYLFTCKETGTGSSSRGLMFSPGEYTGGNKSLRFTASGSGSVFLGAGGGSRVYVGVGRDSVIGWNFNISDTDTAPTWYGSNGEQFSVLKKSELTVIGTGSTTQATTLTIPTDAIVIAATSRVTVQPGGTTSYVLNGTTSAQQFSTSATVSTVAGTTDAGTKGCPFYDAQTNETLTYTFNATTTDALGRIRTTLFYWLITPSSS